MVGGFRGLTTKGGCDEAMLEARSFEDVTCIKMSRTMGGKPLAWVACYLVDGLLVDTGPAHVSQELMRFLENRKVQKVVNTHYHEDHIGSNTAIQKKFGIDVFAHPKAVPEINKLAKLFPYQEMAWGYPVPSKTKRIGKRIETENYQFKVVYTPGHCDDHICLFEREKAWLFSGDLYFSEKPNVARPEERLLETIASLKKVRVLKPKTMFPAPGKVVADASMVLDRTIVYLESLGERVQRLHEKGRSPAEIRDAIFGQEAAMPIAGQKITFRDFTNEQFSTENLIHSFLKD
jgi:glyoxylase-like metal-dependent hydrolase (beta-lactamase superfamily II)